VGGHPRLAPGLPAVWGDVNALQQVIMNLVTNTREALGGRGQVVIETEALADGLRRAS
jgi:signal transduction histidine kinase